MGRRRSNIIIDRPAVDDYGLDGITTKVKSISVYQGVIGGHHEFAVVQKSGRATRQPVEVNEWAHLIRSIKTFEPMIFETPKDSKWCSSCGDWVSKRGFSPDKRNHDGLHVWCKTCRNDMERRRYWSGKQAA